MGNEVRFRTRYMEDRVIVKIGEQERYILMDNYAYSVGPHLYVMSELLYQHPIGEKQRRIERAEFLKDALQEKEEEESMAAKEDFS